MVVVVVVVLYGDQPDFFTPSLLLAWIYFGLLSLRRRLIRPGESWANLFTVIDKCNKGNGALINELFPRHFFIITFLPNGQDTHTFASDPDFPAKEEKMEKSKIGSIPAAAEQRILTGL